MDLAARARLQIRIVIVIYRSEMARLGRSIPAGPERDEHVGALRDRCFAILDTAQAKLDGQAPWHPEVLEQLQLVRAEVSGDP